MFHQISYILYKINYVYFSFHIHICIQAYIQIYKHTNIHTLNHICMHTLMYVYIHIHTYMHTYTHIYIFVYICIYTYIHIYTHTYIYNICKKKQIGIHTPKHTCLHQSKKQTEAYTYPDISSQTYTHKINILSC